MTLDAFLIMFPEFAQTDPVYVTGKLREAVARMGGSMSGGPARIWGGFAPEGSDPTIADIAHANLAAHYLISSPNGTELRLDPDGDGSSQYLTKWNECVEAQCGPPVVVAGGGRAGRRCW